MFNLQVFAEEKREAPTPRRRLLARQRGQVFRSADLVSAVGLVAGVTAMRIWVPYSTHEIAAFAKRLWGNAPAADVGISGLADLGLASLWLVAKTLAVVIGAVLIAGVAASSIQTGAVFTAEPLAPKLDRLNPITGFQRIFSKRAAVEALKSLLKVMIVGWIAFGSVKGEWERLGALSMIHPIEAVARVGDMSVGLFNRAGLGLLIIGMLDMGYQWWEHEMSLKMTRQELKEELKETEGRPEVKARIRQIQRQMAMRRMMQDVKKADVVVTNPTHYAVALRYEAHRMVAPLVLAKGADLLAQRIRSEAEKHGVTIVRNQPLAQALYRMVDIGKAIPPELYQGVAEVLAFVYRLKSRAVHE
ncbi:MAG: flagellar biosynthesis protein FlhB [Firmicutes bacterium]|nr:flagellar biosynthesis protein FlhB [Bacillota bacterium]